MAAYLFWEFVILIAGVWLMVVLFVIYGWLLLKRQRQMFLEISSLLNTTPTPLPQESEKITPHLDISRNEPLSKYKDVAQDEIDVSFVDDTK